MPPAPPSSLDVYAALGRRPPALWWSKLEIVLGLGAAGIGLVWAGESGPLRWFVPALIALGGYLALAGHRSHLYDAMTRQSAATWARLGGGGRSEERSVGGDATRASAVG